MIRGKQGTCVLIFSKEGVTQGDPLSMFGYGIGVLPLIRRLKEEFPSVKQPWYAGAGGHFTELRAFMERLQEIGPAYGYHPEPTKSILVVQAHNLVSARSEFKDLGRIPGYDRLPLSRGICRLQLRAGAVGPGKSVPLD